MNARILKGKQWHGTQTSMPQYLYGIKVQLLVTKDVIPVEFSFVSGSQHDAQVLKKLPMKLPVESEVFADATYNNYKIEDLLMEND